HIHGTGGFWLQDAEPNASAREIHYEETNWKARPDFSPDGSRMVYGSYLGRQWQQLWVMPAKGGDAFPISYGEYENTNVRWSPDGKSLAFISNRNGNTEIWLQESITGRQEQLRATAQNFLRPHGTLTIGARWKGNNEASRISVSDPLGRFFVPLKK